MNSITRALVMTGVAMTTRTLVTSIVQTMIGIRNRVIPGARILKIVTRKLMPPRIELVPMRASETSHRSCPGPGDFVGPTSDRGGELGQPAAGAPPRGGKPASSRDPPRGRIKKEKRGE